MGSNLRVREERSRLRGTRGRVEEPYAGIVPGDAWNWADGRGLTRESDLRIAWTPYRVDAEAVAASRELTDVASVEIKKLEVRALLVVRLGIDDPAPIATHIV